MGLSIGDFSAIVLLEREREDTKSAAARSFAAFFDFLLPLTPFLEGLLGMGELE
jgi:hypothetical protein